MTSETRNESSAHQLISYFRAAVKTVDHLATKCDRMLCHDYIRRHNEILKCIHLTLCNKYGSKNSKKLRSH